ncbi:unnamed protein product [Anisakis simplex]|uniref:SCP domain-containing protein n=1 Tax=Anisakis simplex TaxID=6269 RepID=A0A0M3JTR9_ANISI|nr:unnamed protein product [Anisakis simplex]
MVVIEASERFYQQIIDAHNRFRAQHGSEPLVVSAELSEQAQNWANKLALRGHLAYCELPGIGENITFFPLWIDGEKVVEHWYNEHVKYEYDTPGWQAGTNYFTQVVWKSTSEIGIGRSFVAARPVEQQTALGAIALPTPTITAVQQRELNAINNNSNDIGACHNGDNIDSDINTANKILLTTSSESTSNNPFPGEQIVVVFYRPAGNNNRAGQFATNVLKPKVVSN